MMIYWLKVWWYGRIRGVCPICRAQICHDYPRPGVEPIFKRGDK